MQCPPCQNAMNSTVFVDEREDAMLGWISGWRCGRCGYTVNPLPEFNRRFAERSLARQLPIEPIRVWEDC